MKKQFTLLQLFSIVDGRLSTSIVDVYEMLNHICDTSLMTHHLPVAMNYVKQKNPQWFRDADRQINAIKTLLGTNEFQPLFDYIKESANDSYEIPQLKDEFYTEDFGSFMVDNSLLKTIN